MPRNPNNPRPRGTLAERIARSVDTSAGPDACHPWTGAVHRKRGTLSDTPLVCIGKSTHNPRRVVREADLGVKLETAQRVRDTCGNTICCNPRHLKGGTLADRLEAQIDKNGPIPAACPELGPCWVWTGYTLKRYGRLRTKRGTPWVFAHRLAYMTAHGVDLPKEVLVLHHCDNPPCCNPAHLRPGTNAENHRDMEIRGRMQTGENHRKAARNAKALREAGYVKERRPPGRPKKRAA